MVKELSIAEARDMFLAVAAEMIAAKDRLTKADQKIGDGDHGIGIARGFEAVQVKLEEDSSETLDALLKTVGMTLLSAIGGAGGAIFGTLFRAGAKTLSGRESLDSESLAIMLSEGFAAVQARGGAKLGDKTMLDALGPASEAASAVAPDASLSDALAAAVAAAQSGTEATIDMIATTGKARSLGERSIGHPDPGAISTTLILEAMERFVRRYQEKGGSRGASD
ncbi:MAG: dihydroxyacetone kinase subunit L [Rhodospirillales bacterium]|mgnify:CR=1 FL=1|jgi:phosphoenolpyruvate---glycerone phosphotransferase subunit DhaL|nr:dihydroxyacetone kinase subunit L [Rhodospirillales bacterium]